MTGPVCGLVLLLSSIDPGQIIALGGGGAANLITRRSNMTFKLQYLPAVLRRICFFMRPAQQEC